MKGRRLFDEVDGVGGGASEEVEEGGRGEEGGEEGGLGEGEWHVRGRGGRG